jgi:hypothetical protein
MEVCRLIDGAEAEVYTVVRVYTESHNAIALLSLNQLANLCMPPPDRI